MTKIEFRTNLSDKINYTCRWVRQTLSHSRDTHMVLFSSDHMQLSKLDEMLWTFSDEDFLPHVMANDPQAHRSPIILTNDDNIDFPHRKILVNLSTEIPASFAQFERLLEIISTDSTDTEAGRKRYAHYRQRGYSLHHEVAK